ncbi:MAG: DUF302 domain-containing protein [Thermoleophilia bacterium]
MTQAQNLSFDVHLDESHEDAIEKVTSALKAEGFGVLTSVDVREAFKEKLGEEFRPYTILGACKPALAYRALSHMGEVGLMLPCNVTVEADPAGGSIVRIIDPEALMKGAGMDTDPVLAEVGSEARVKLGKVARALEES